MAEKTVFKLNRAGVRQLLKSSAMQAAVREHADRIARRCGSGYAADTKVMGTRVIASAYAGTDGARRDNLKNNTILKNTYGEG